VLPLLTHFWYLIYGWQVFHIQWFVSLFKYFGSNVSAENYCNTSTDPIIHTRTMCDFQYKRTLIVVATKLKYQNLTFWNFFDITVFKQIREFENSLKYKFKYSRSINDIIYAMLTMLHIILKPTRYKNSFWKLIK